MLPALGYNLLTTSAEGANGPAEKKSLTTTYVLWLFGGFFGLHHFYLGRDEQAFLWWASLGGYFGFGWLRDLFVIPRYVAEVNQDPKYFEGLIQKIKAHPTVCTSYFTLPVWVHDLMLQPPFSGWRFAGMTVFGYLFAALTMYAIPEEELFGYSFKFLYFLIPVACALGKW